MSLPTRQGNYEDPRERERLLAQYAGIFPHAIKQFGETMKKQINKPRKNYAR